MSECECITRTPSKFGETVGCGLGDPDDCPMDFDCIIKYVLRGPVAYYGKITEVKDNEFTVVTKPRGEEE